MNLNQILAVSIAILGVLMASTAQLNDLLGTTVAHTIVSLAGLLNSIIASMLAVFTGNAGMLKSVAALPSVDRVQVNTQATPALAAVAVDPEQPKVGGTAQNRAELEQIAKG